jgi:transposase InsO family protein
VPPAAVREQLRLAFARWGLPRRLRVDNGAPWGSTGDFPTELALWVIGLGVEMRWNAPRAPQENGVVERSQGTSGRWCEPRTCATAAELQERLDRMDRLHREVYPYREGLSRMAYFPGLAHSGRPYAPDSEETLWEWSRVAEHLPTYVLVRRVDRSGLVSLYNRGRYVGKIHQGKDVYVMYDPGRNEWFFTDLEGRQLRRQPADELSRERVMGLEVTHRR